MSVLKRITMKHIFCLLLLSGFAQLATAQKAEQALQTLDQNFPQEKVYILYSKSSYVAGETMWFSAYVLDGYSRSSVSTSLFVELYSSNKTQVDKKIIPLFNGEGNGSFVLPDTLKEGAYYVRAYTTWMLNFSEDFQYIKPIPVYNTKSSEKLVADTTSPWTATARPEGGSLIEGVTTRVAVRLHSAGLTPAIWSGYIIETSKPAEKLSPFKGFDRNVGLANITPQKGKKYQLVVEDTKGKKQTVDLPAVATSGVSLQVNSTTDAIDYSLKFVNIPSIPGHKVIGTINNTLVYRAAINKESPEVNSSIPADKLINGILRLTVFDPQENVVAERLCFIQPEMLNVGRPAFPPLYLSKSARGLNAFDIAPDTTYLNYTILVRDGSVADDLEDDNLLSTLWLTGDLTDKIQAPARYLSIVGDIAALDALLMSETWKRFSWKDIMQGKFPEVKYIPQSYISYKGKVTTAGGRVAANSTVNLIFYFPDSTNQITQVDTDANGEFVLNNLVFDEPFKVYYQLNTEKGSTASRQTSIIFEPLYMFVPYGKALPPSGYTMVKRPANDKIPDDIARALTTLGNQRFNEEKIKTLEAITITASQRSNKEKLNEQLSSGMFRSMNEDVFDFVNEHPEAASFQNILQWLQGRVAGLQIQMQNGTYVPIIRGQRAGLFLNEMPTDPNQIASLPVADIAMVKVIRSGFMGGPGGGGAGSAVAIYTKRGDTRPAAGANTPPALNNATLNGYDKVADFYAPDYKEAAYKGIEKDTRDVIFWNPNIPAMPNKPVTVRFYNNDDGKSLRVIIIGFDKDSDTPLFYNDIFK